MTPETVQRVGEQLRHRLADVIVGLDDAVTLLLVALLADGHVLVEDVPGTGKTTLARSLASILGLDFARIQCTPDLLPSDVTGLYWFNQQTSAFDLRRGPIFANVVLADEINRATPRTQSAMLEGMAERQVTLDGRTHPLPEPFLLIATQNPVELEGTFPLPEAQLDRFLVRVTLGYPSEEAEHAIVLRHANDTPLRTLEALEAIDVPELRGAAARVHVSDPVRDYLIRVVRRTRDASGIELGASPRASVFLYRASQALAALQGRNFVRPDDVKAVAPAVLAHRLILDPGLELRGGGGEDVVAGILSDEPVPAEAV